jgi:alpha-amylase
MKTKFILFFSTVLILAACKQQEPVSDNALVDGHPAWMQQSNIYEVNTRQYTPEGTFNAFAAHLDRLKEMGVEVLWFMPINPISKVDRKGTLGSYYAVSDYTAINPEYGNLNDWKALVNKAHEKGFKVLIDWVPNHTGADHTWLTTHPDFYVRDSITGKAVSQFDWTDTRKLNYKNPAVTDSMIAAMQYWIKETNIDGYRCDQAHLVDSSFWYKAISQLKKEKNILMIAESEDAWVHRAGFDISYPWKAFHIMTDIVIGKKNALYLDSIQEWIDSNFTSNASLLYFTSNHDENSWNQADYGTMPGDIHKPFAVLTQTLPRAVPMIYSGQEEPILREIPFFEKDTIPFAKYERAEFYKKLLQLRKTHPALAAQVRMEKQATNNDEQVYAFTRTAKQQTILVITNLSKEAQTINVNPVLQKKLGNKKYKDILSGAEMQLSAPLKLKPWDALVFSYEGL